MNIYNCKPPPILERLTQKIKPELQDQDLRKCLNLLDLIIQGLAHIIGAGIFVITPGVLSGVSGPSLVFSYMVSAVVLMFTVLCYMDLGARYRGIGNAYVYIYATLGELGAGFVWVFMTIEMCLAEGLIAIGFGKNVDKFLMNSTFQKMETGVFNTFLPEMVAGNINTLAISCLVLACVVNCIGIKQVLWVNTAVVSYALFVLSGYFVTSMIYGNYETFSNSTDPVTGHGGVFPFGIFGMIQGSAVVVIAFCGFETIVTLSAESRNPKADVPLAMFISYAISVTFYIMTAFSIGYLIPWYEIAGHESTGIPYTLQYHDLTIPAYIAVSAVLLATLSVVLCQLTSISRSVYKVACDGLFFQIFTNVTECSQVPVVAIIGSTVLTIAITVLFSYDTLIHLVSGGALLVFFIINYSLVVISYTTPVKEVDENTNLVNSEIERESGAAPVEGQECKVAAWMALFAGQLLTLCCFLHGPESWAFWSVRLPLITVILVPAVGTLIYIRYRFILQTSEDQSFVCPLVPFVPGLGMALNLFFFSFLSSTAHFITLIYILAGAFVYFTYGYSYSSLTAEKQRLMLEDEARETIPDQS